MFHLRIVEFMSKLSFFALRLKSCMHLISIFTNCCFYHFFCFSSKTQILCLSSDILKSCSEIESTDNVDMDLLTSIELIFKSQSCINGSFLLDNEGHYCCTSKHSGLNIELADLSFNYLRKTENENVKQLIWDCITSDLLQTLIASPPDIETLRIYLILPLYHEFVNSKNYLKLHIPFSRAVLNLHLNPLKIIQIWWSTQSRDYFERLVEIYKNVVCYIIQFQLKKQFDEEGKQLIFYDTNLSLMLNTMVLLFRVNHFQRVNKVPYDIFHIPELTETVNLQHDYIRWITDKDNNVISIY